MCGAGAGSFAIHYCTSGKGNVTNQDHGHTRGTNRSPAQNKAAIDGLSEAIDSLPARLPQEADRAPNSNVQKFTIHSSCSNFRMFGHVSDRKAIRSRSNRTRDQLPSQPSQSTLILGVSIALCGGPHEGCKFASFQSTTQGELRGFMRI